MRRKMMTGVAAAAAALGLLAGGAMASGPAAPGKELVEINCAGTTYLVSVQRAEDSSGVGQIVGQKGHGIPVTFGFSVFDVTTGTLLFSEVEQQGGGHAHQNQATTSCSFVAFEGTAADLFGDEPLPPGVDPSDTILAIGTVEVILKL